MTDTFGIAALRLKCTLVIALHYKLGPMTAGINWLILEREISQLLRQADQVEGRRRVLTAISNYSESAVREARRLGDLVPDSPECNQSWLFRPVFVCGHHRSGTTLMQRLLDGHPHLLSLPSEGTYFTSFRYVTERNPSDQDLERFCQEWISRFIDPNFNPHFRLGYSDDDRCPAVDFARRFFGWHFALRGTAPLGFAPLLALTAAYRAVTAPHVAPRQWVEKTPLNETHVSRFAPFDQARFIQIVRDPKATFASLSAIYRTREITGFDAARCARGIAQSYRLARLNARHLNDRYLIVRYEDLVDKTDAQMRRVNEFLGISFDSRLLLPTAGGQPVEPNSAFNRTPAGNIGRTGSPLGLTANDLKTLGVYTAAQARNFGYDLQVPMVGKCVFVRTRDCLIHGARLASRAFRRGRQVFGL